MAATLRDQIEGDGQAIMIAELRAGGIICAIEDSEANVGGKLECGILALANVCKELVMRRNIVRFRLWASGLRMASGQARLGVGGRYESL